MSSASNLNFLNLIQELKVFGEFAKFAGNAWTWPLGRRSKHPRVILLIPGFLAGDATLYPFANWLRSQGHRVFFSGILANIDCPRRAMDRLGRILQGLYDRHDEKLVVIGHSLGGVYARELARRAPDQVEQTILLASPVGKVGERTNPFVHMLATFTMKSQEFMRGCSGDLRDVCGVHSPTPPPNVPEAIIFSKADGVVDWSSCLESGPNVEAFEVNATHCGLPYNLDTLRIVHDLIENGQTPRERKARGGKASVNSKVPSIGSRHANGAAAAS
ncbi:MAG TPA: alpha/beta hydrolase [Candidatus Binataceae bacterium]|nr:alpha/beta hydrolase [Candidatus Binataceae bacterium]